MTVTGSNPATVELGDTYTDAGATATDLSGVVTVVTTGSVDTDTVGEYTLTYTSTDHQVTLVLQLEQLTLLIQQHLL